MPPPLPGFEMMIGQDMHIALQQMLYYTFVGDASALESRIGGFINDNNVDELMITNYIYDINDRKHSMEIVRNLFQ